MSVLTKILKMPEDAFQVKPEFIVKKKKKKKKKIEKI